MIRVVIADDHNLVRQGIRALLERAGDINVVGEAEDGLQALELVQRLRPQVLVADIAMPGLNGIELVKRICEQGGATQVLILSMYADETLIRQAMTSGAYGYVLKSSLTDELLVAIRAAQRGEVFLNSGLSPKVLAEWQAQPTEASPLDRLTAREREVLQLIAEGDTNKEIASKLTISERTVEKHRASLMHKLNVIEIAGLVRLAIRYHVVFDEDVP